MCTHVIWPSILNRLAVILPHIIVDIFVAKIKIERFANLSDKLSHLIRNFPYPIDKSFVYVSFQ